MCRLNAICLLNPLGLTLSKPEQLQVAVSSYQQHKRRYTLFAVGLLS